jgi:adenylosuccinate synthase
MSELNAWMPTAIVSAFGILLSALGISNRKHVTRQNERIKDLEDTSVTEKTCLKCSENINNQLKAIHESVVRSEKISLTVLKNMSKRIGDIKPDEYEHLG